MNASSSRHPIDWALFWRAVGAWAIDESLSLFPAYLATLALHFLGVPSFNPASESLLICWLASRMALAPFWESLGLALWGRTPGMRALGVELGPGRRLRAAIAPFVQRLVLIGLGFCLAPAFVDAPRPPLLLGALILAATALLPKIWAARKNPLRWASLGIQRGGPIPTRWLKALLAAHALAFCAWFAVAVWATADFESPKSAPCLVETPSRA